jgi:hypothetical protein
LTAWHSLADTVRVRSHHRIFSLLTLLGWLFAAGHVALEHGGVANGSAHHALPGGVDDDDHDDHDDGAPSQDGEHHHHDLSALNAGQWVKSAEQKALAPAWVPLFDVLAARIADILREGREPRVLRTREHAPPDERAFGWLLVSQTALRVRGPSLPV